MTPNVLAVTQGAPLVAAWVVTTLGVTSLFTLAAAVLHRLARGSVPYRWVWGTALVLAFGFTVTQPWRRAESRMPLAMPVRTVETTQVAPSSAPSAWDAVSTIITHAPAFAEEALASAATGAAATVRTLPLAAQWCIVLFWPVASGTLLFIGVWTYRRQRAVLRDAARVNAHGHTLHVTAATGPAVYGVLRPRIVAPAWLMQRTPDEQRLVIAHEQAHIAAGDPVLLLTACALTALMPWNPCAWYLLARLRLAIELDCDARVLESGATPRHYGALLIDLSASATPAPLLTGATAFSHHASHLERRLRFMTDRPATHKTARRFASLSLGTLALVAACGAELPTSAELEGMDVAAATARISAVAPSASKQYFIDGRAASESEARAIAANRIASITVMKQDKGVQAIRLTTKTGASTVADDAAMQAGSPVVTMRINQIDSTATALRIADTAARLSFTAVRDARAADTSRPLAIGDRMVFVPAGKSSDVLIFVDGVKATESAMKMPPDRIQSIEVIKGAAAEKLYGPEGAKGVIRITTKKN
jgi:TonB-dependent SusC/RagA subfamily outer membrane receptor